jgi:hypothetical protein
MKHVTTVLCSIAFLIAGWLLAIENKEGSFEFNKHQTLSAATIPHSNVVSMLPLDVQLDLGKRTQSTDSVEKQHDTVYVDRPQILVINKKHQGNDPPKGVTDYAWMFHNPVNMSTGTVSNKKIPDREEKTGERDVGTPDSTTIQLIVDGRVVYSKNDNHSTGELQ